VNPAVGGFDLVQHGADLARPETGVAEERHEFLEGGLEVDVVLPKRIVGVDDQGEAHDGWESRRLKSRRLAAATVGGRQFLHALDGAPARNIRGQVLIQLLQAAGFGP